MIPLRLQLKNFLSYGPLQTIDFSSHHLICLSGKNGHGKSALLDAITWALWGQARKIGGATKADEKLVKLGYDHVMVVFDFESNHQYYRVRREFSSHGNKSVLDFGIIQPETQAYKPLTDKTIRGTQEKIEAVLGLSYESFINSAFIRQGQSNEFSKKSPQERKELLSNILGLDRYEGARKRALELVRDTTQKKVHYQMLSNRALPVLERKSMVEQELSNGQQQLHKVVEHQQLLQNEYKDVTIKKNELQQKLSELRLSLVQVAEQQKNYQHLTKNLQETVIEWRRINQLINNHGKKDYRAEKERIERQLENLQQQMNRRATLQEQLLHIKMQLQQIEQQAKEVSYQQINLLERRVQECVVQNEQLEKRLQEVATINEQYQQEYQLLASERQQSETISSKVEILEQQKKDIQQKIEKYGATYERWQHRQQVLQQAVEQTEQKIKIACHIDLPTCALCEQALPQQQQQLLVKKFTSEQTWYLHQQRRLQVVVPQLNQRYGNFKQQLIQISLQLDAAMLSVQKVQLYDQQLTTITIKQAEQEKLVAQMHEQKTALLQQQQELVQQKEQFIQQAAQHLQHHDVYQQLCAAFKEHEHELAGLHDVQEKLRAAQLVRDEIYKQLLIEQEIFIQQQQQLQRRGQVTSLCEQLKQLKTTLAGHHVATRLLENIQVDYNQIVRRQEMIEQELHSLVMQKEQLIVQKTKLEQQKLNITEVEQELRQSQQQLKELENVSEEYQLIAQAFGKDGIQALLIEHAIPDIEREANAILSRLTDNLAQVSIESLRDLKSGGTKETLDIKISDAVGIRPYELYSGGEAFRIDFALRIAIAKLLARRAGATLQTLIIDEGFGSQDEEGLSNITEALYKIQQDFAKIIIVSHLPTMKEQFPTQFHIHKGPEGSTVRVVQLG